MQRGKAMQDDLKIPGSHHSQENKAGESYRTAVQKRRTLLTAKNNRSR
jgi:hypothetical protein